MKFTPLAFAASASAAALTTIDPCPSCPGFSKITVTAQHQVVSTCSAAASCATVSGTASCTTAYPCSTYTYVSTVIPCAGTGSALSSCTVTAIDQPVTVSIFDTTSTTYTTIPVTSSATASSAASTITSAAVLARDNLAARASIVAIANVDTTIIDYVAPYSDLGPIAISGYPGNGLCKVCTAATDGTVIQVVDVHSCVDASCTDYTETWVASPTTALPCTQSLSTTASCPTDGTYTVTVAPETCLTKDITGGPTTVVYGGTTQDCPENGVYTVYLDENDCHTATVTNAPTQLVYPPVSQYCPNNGACTVTLASAISVVTAVFNAPTIIIVQTIQIDTIQININNFGTVVAGTTVVPTVPGGVVPTLVPQPIPALRVGLRDWVYIGCESTTAPFQLISNTPGNTINSCLADCVNFDFAAIFNTECYCADANAPATLLADSTCNTPCPGNPFEACGGNLPAARLRRDLSDALSVYGAVIAPDLSSSVTPTTTSSATTADPSSDFTAPAVAAAKPKARSLQEKKFKNPQQVRRGGLLRSPQLSEKKDVKEIKKRNIRL